MAECGKVWSTAMVLYGSMQATLEGMPKTAPYKQVAQAITTIQKSYSILTKLKCFGAKRPKDAKLCTSIAQVAMLTQFSLDADLR